MATDFQYRALDVAQTLTSQWQLGSASDSVKISIYDMDDSAVDVNAVAMTSVTGGLFTYAWTPSEAHTYRIDYHNLTLDSHNYEFVMVLDPSDESTVPTGSFAGSTLATLRSKFLRLIDNYNSDDLTGDNSSGDVADICINDALDTIYATIKASRYTDQYGSTSLVSTANQAYIALSAISNIDEIVALKDTANQWKLEEKTPEWYFRNVPNPAGVTGTPHIYCRILNRIYLHPRPTSAITYTCEYKSVYGHLTADTDMALIPTHYDRWIMAEAWVIWLMGEDPNAVGAIGIAQKERDRCESKFLNDMFSNFDRIPMSASHFLENENRRWLPYNSPMDGT